MTHKVRNMTLARALERRTEPGRRRSEHWRRPCTEGVPHIGLYESGLVGARNKSEVWKCFQTDLLAIRRARSAIGVDDCF
jgi:hypothetical protein